MGRLFLFLFIAIISQVHASAQVSATVKQPRILILLDESSSMINKWDGDKERYKTADEIILRLMDSIYKVNDQVEFSLRVFGHQYPVPQDNCYDTKNEVMFSKNNYTQMALRLADLHPLGVTPIAYSLQQAAENDLVNERDYSYSIILITDGGESCGGNICDVVKTLIAKKIYFKPYIVSLVDYAPLKTEYACLGEYLQVVKETDIPKTINTIVESYTPALTEAKTGIRQPEVKPAPPVVQVSPAPVTVIPSPAKPIVVAARPSTEIKPMQPHPVQIVNTTIPPATTPHTIKVQPIVPATPPPARVNTNIDYMTPNWELITFPLVYFSYPVKKIYVPKLNVLPIEPDENPVITPVIKPVAEKRLVKKPAIIRKPVNPVIKVVNEVKEKEVPFEKHTQDAAETTVEIYFTNGHGRFYSTAPKVLLLDPVTHQEVKTFYRIVDISGSPQPQKDIPAGTYDLTVAGKTNLILRNVVIQDHKANIITVTVGTGALKFHYNDAPDRPVTEFSAIVIQREMADGKTTVQKCTQELEYDAGNYFVQVNTLPVMRRNLDLDFDAEYDMGIDQPGFLQVTNTDAMGKAGLYTPSGDKFLQFYSMNISGIPASQKVRLQPGIYELHYKKNPNLPFATETVVPFRIKPTETTTIELQK